jgi:hypothetical protein
MDRRQKIMRLIIDHLTANDEAEYTYTGAVTVLDPHLISLDFTLRTGTRHTALNVRGLIDVPLRLVPQYEDGFFPDQQPHIHQQIEKDLRSVSNKINKVL